jgi:hypothetical protein
MKMVKKIWLFIVSVLIIFLGIFEAQANTCVQPFACNNNLFISLIDPYNLMENKTITLRVVDENGDESSGTISVDGLFGHDSSPPSPHFSVTISGPSGTSLVKILFFRKKGYEVYKGLNGGFQIRSRE